MPSFLPVPVDGCEAKGHDETERRYQVQIDVSEVTCHNEIVSVTSKKQGPSALARQPNGSLGKWQEGGYRNFVNVKKHFVLKI